MRIAVVAAPHVTVPPERYGGSEQVINYLVKGLKELGHQPILLAAGDSKVDCPLIPIVDTAIGFPQTAAEKPAYDKLVEQANRRITEVLTVLKPNIDIIHSNGYDLLPFADMPNLTTLHCKIVYIA